MKSAKQLLFVATGIFTVCVILFLTISLLFEYRDDRHLKENKTRGKNAANHVLEIINTEYKCEGYDTSYLEPDLYVFHANYNYKIEEEKIEFLLSYKVLELSTFFSRYYELSSTYYYDEITQANISEKLIKIITKFNDFNGKNTEVTNQVLAQIEDKFPLMISCVISDNNIVRGHFDNFSYEISSNYFTITI